MVRRKCNRYKSRFLTLSLMKLEPRETFSRSAVLGRTINVP
jgi:hypothetical protein